MENQVTVTKSEELIALEQKQAAEFALTPVGKMIKNMEAISQVAKFYAASDFVPATFKGKPENCTIAIDMAARMGMNPIMVMQQMYIVNGKPSISTQLVIAMINNCGEFEPLKFESNGKGGDDFGMRAWTVRKKDPNTRLDGTWITMKMVKASKWGNKWQEIPEQMFKYRAAMFWARLNAPEITMGFYSKDEVEEPDFETETIHDAAPVKSPAEIAMEEMKRKKAEKERAKGNAVIYPEAKAQEEAEVQPKTAAEAPSPAPFDEPETSENAGNANTKAGRTLV